MRVFKIPKFLPVLGLILLLTAGTILGQVTSSTNYQITAGNTSGGAGVGSSTGYDEYGGGGIGTMGVGSSTNYKAFGGVTAALGSLGTLTASLTKIVSPLDTIPRLDTVIAVTYANYAGPVSGQIHYRQRGAVSYSTGDMVNVGEDILRFALNTNVLTARGLEYYLTITDGSSTVLKGNSDNPYSIIMDMTNPTGQRPTPMPEASYRIVSVPIDIQGTGSPQIVFANNLGASDITQWRLGQYDTEDDTVYSYPDVSNVLPGQGYWLIARHGRRYGSAGFSISPNGSHNGNPYYIVDVDSGWVQLGNPLPFNVSWAEVLVYDNDILQTGHPDAILDDAAYYYNGHDYDSALYIPAWEGAFVKIKQNNISLGFRFREYLPPVMMLPPAQPYTTDQFWSVKLTLKTESAEDVNNYIGVRPDAKAGDDQYDFSEPPMAPEGAYLALSIPGEKGLFRTDFRPKFNDGAVWNLNFSLKPNRVLSFRQLEQLPKEMEAWIIMDNDTKVLVNANTNITLPDSVRAARLMIGTRLYLSDMVDDLLPTTFSLEQNYPNPFNPMTNINFALPTPGHVRLDIYNILGQRVSTLIDRDMVSGRHTITWDSHDNSGRSVASGIYFYRIEYNQESLTRKMVLLK